MVRPAVPDPTEIAAQAWWGFRGYYAWDVGANCGQSIVHFKMFHGGRFSFFEPSEDSASYLKRMYSWADVHPIALSDHDGELELAYPAREQRDTGQLVTPGTEGMEWSPPDWSVIPRVTVPCRTADSMVIELGEPDFIKVDTEGHECQVLAGAKRLLARGEVKWLIEFHTPGNLSWCQRELTGAGYVTEIVRHPYYRTGGKMWRQHGWLRAFPLGSGLWFRCLSVSWWTPGSGCSSRRSRAGPGGCLISVRSSSSCWIRREPDRAAGEFRTGGIRG